MAGCWGARKEGERVWAERGKEGRGQVEEDAENKVGREGDYIAGEMRTLPTGDLATPPPSTCQFQISRFLTSDIDAHSGMYLQ